MGVLALILNVLFAEETYLKTILRKRAAKIRQETGNLAIHHLSEEEIIDFNTLVYKHLLSPLKLLFCEPIVLLICSYTAFNYGILYLFLEAYPIIFTEYRGISPALSTLPYIGLIIGIILGCGIVIFFVSRYNKKLRENNNRPVPEQRLIPMMIGAAFLPIGLFWLAWTGNYPSVHWIVPSLSGIFTGAGIVIISLQALNYLLDAYLTVAVSAIAANVFMRSSFGQRFRCLLRLCFIGLVLSEQEVFWGFWRFSFCRFRFCFLFFGERLRGLSRHTPTEVYEKRRQSVDEETLAGAH